MEKRILFFLASLAAISGLLYSCEQAAEEVAVTAVIISQPSAEMIIGETLTLTATVSPSNATDQEVTWASSEQSVATVDENGKVDAISVGETIITATAGGKKAVCQVTVKNNLPLSLTVGADNISAISVVLKGKASISTSSYITVGFQYSLSADILLSNSTVVYATNADANYDYSAVVTGLEPETTYFFRSFAFQDGQYTYGETKEFTTKDLKSLLETEDASDIEATHAHLNGFADLLNVSLVYKTIEYGFYWGTSEAVQNIKVEGGSISGNIYAAHVTGLFGKRQYWFKAYVKLDDNIIYGELKTFTTPDYPEFVDLGLSVKWRGWNIGASKPEEYGLYFAWGETEPKSDYSWSTYKWGTSQTSLTKYNYKESYGTIDYKTILEPEDDAAHVKLGGSWRMPTDDEFTELLTKCTGTWTESFNETGVKGIIVAAPNGNSIFLPAAGCRFGTEFLTDGIPGYYWSSSVWPGIPSSGSGVFIFPSNLHGEVAIQTSSERCIGRSVRPVCD